ncbi:ATP-binding protein [Pleomorphochaeta sp. DL1XJH-081]|uniref:ATP-binding protein n=1 Tax=Pleomorphochaeta sp. DL1XJH-081 TaxID=3409690 RepID=UPI003BB525A3
MTLENTKAIKASDNLVMIVYGKGGAGKTTFAASAPRPLILDFENGTKYLGERGINADVVRMRGWFSPQDINELALLLRDHDTVVIDPLGEAMEKLIDSPNIRGKQYRTGDGALTMAGWGEVKKQMRNFIKWLRDTGKHVIIVSHVSEISTEQGLEKRIQVATKLSDEIPNMVDVISYLGIQKQGDDFVRSLFTPSQGGLFDSKDRTGRIPMVVEIGEHTGWQDLMNAMVAPSMPQPTSSPIPNQTQQEAPNTTQPPSRITVAQTTEMRSLAERMSDPAGKSYLLQKAVSGITFEEAQEIINRAKASLGV